MESKIWNKKLMAEKKTLVTGIGRDEQVAQAAQGTSGTEHPSVLTTAPEELVSDSNLKNWKS